MSGAGEAVLAEVEGWAAQSERLLERIGPRFARPEVRRVPVVERLGDPGGVLVVDETGFLEKGNKFLCGSSSRWSSGGPRGR